MRIRAITCLCVVLAAGLTACPSGVQEPAYDLVIRNGRVMDPESGLDAVRDVGILAGRIASIEAGPLHGREVLDATGRVWIGLLTMLTDCQTQRWMSGY